MLQIWQNSCNPLSDNSEIFTIQHLGAVVPGMGVSHFTTKKEKKSLTSETDRSQVQFQKGLQKYEYMNGCGIF
jgi:hypothetical protein